jgi:hypothetical protein
MPYAITHKPSDVICQCGAIVKVTCMAKHLPTAKHQRDLLQCQKTYYSVKRDLLQCQSIVYAKHLPTAKHQRDVYYASLYERDHFTTPHFTTPHFTTPHFTTLHFTTPHFTTPHFTTPHFTTPHFTTPHKYYASLYYASQVKHVCLSAAGEREERERDLSAASSSPAEHALTVFAIVTVLIFFCS